MRYNLNNLSGDIDAVIAGKRRSQFGPRPRTACLYGTKPAPPAPLGGGSRSASVGNPTGSGAPTATTLVANVARN